MWGLLRDAAEGWRELIRDEKYMALLLAALMYLWFKRFRDIKSRRTRDKMERDSAPFRLLFYATFILALVVAPPLGMFLRAYQTRFYDYTWVLAYIPMTLMIAYGATEAYVDCLKSGLGQSAWKAAVLAALMLAVFLLCGNLGTGDGDASPVLPEETVMGGADETAGILELLQENENADEICLWAPAGFLEDVRALNGEITLLYGRNMWEKELNAYSYDTYPEQIEEAYRWMEDCSAYLLGYRQELPGDKQYLPRDLQLKNFQESTGACVKAAMSQGVNCILLPEGTDAAREETVFQAVTEYMEEAGYGMIKTQAYGYTILRLDRES